MAELAVQSENASGPIDFDALRAKLGSDVGAQRKLIQETYALSDDMLEALFKARELGVKPLGNDGMVATPTNQAEIAVSTQDGQAAPTSQEYMMDVELVNQQRDAGRSTIEVDADLVARATAMALAMKDRGASPEQIEQAIGKLSGINLENLKAVLTAVEKNTDATNFSLVGNQQAQQEEQAKPFTLGALVDAIAPPQPQASTTEPSFGNLMWGEKPKTVETSAPVQDNPFANLLKDTGIIENLNNAFKGTGTSEPQAKTGQAQEQQHDGWAR